MLLQKERESLLSRKMLKTDIARTLYQKYYYTLFEFSKDLRNSNVSEILIRDDSVVIKTRREGIFLNCPEGDMTSALGQLILAGTENDEQQMMIRLMTEITGGKEEDDGAVFFDVGANIGWYSIYFDKIFKNIRIHAFEPIHAAFAQLEKNLALNQSGCIKANNLGLADRNETVDFYVSPSLLAASSLADTFPTGDKIKVRGDIRKLDDYCCENNVVPDFIKCDVEGAELLVARGAEKTLSEAKPVVMMELLRKWAKCFNYHPNDVIRLMKKKNYACYTIDGDRLHPCKCVTDDTVETNFFFLHNEVHREIRSQLAVSEEYR